MNAETKDYLKAAFKRALPQGFYAASASGPVLAAFALMTSLHPQSTPQQAHDMWQIALTALPISMASFGTGYFLNKRNRDEEKALKGNSSSGLNGPS